MKAALLYATTNRELLDQCVGRYQSVYVSGWGWVYARAELVEVNDLVETLDLATPREGETFLNGIPLP